VSDDPTRETTLALQDVVPTPGSGSSRPTVAGRYQLLDEIARGGMGIVYRARDTVLDREVAVKVLQERFAPGSLVARRFLDEARITGQLQHPGVPAVHDLGTLPDGRPFLAMKLIKGQTLEEQLKSRTTPESERGRFLAIFEALCQAVGYAHAHDVIHRDLKPLNVMVGAHGEVQVMDWGLAKLLTEVQTQADDPSAVPTGAETAIQSQREPEEATRAGTVLGTPAYMPPEQAIGAIDQLDQRSDVFGLGAILCVLLTGRPPYRGADAEATRQLAARAKLDDAFARLDASGAEPELIALCKRCLAAEKAERPADATEVAQVVTSLRAAADERARQAKLERVRAEEQRKLERVRSEEEKKRRRVQMTLALSVVGLLVTLGFGVVLALFWQDAERAKREAVEAKGEAVTARDAEIKARVKAEEAKGEAVTAREQLAGVEYARTMQVAYDAWRENNVAATLALLASTRPELRGWEWHFVYRLCHSDLLTLKGHTGRVRSASFSPDGTRIVTASEDQTARLWDVKTGTATLTLKGHASGVQSASFSPDGTRIVTASYTTAKVWDARPVIPVPH
jgi:serine/threonine protein kinase